MKGLLVNLLIVLSLGLCAFNAYQWYREARLRGRMESLGTEIYNRSSEIQSLKQSLSISQDEIKRLEGIRESLGSALQSNRTVIAELRRESAKFKAEAELQAAKAAQLDQYREAFEKANENLKKQNEIIQSQNEKMRELAEDRNEIVTRFNKLAADYKTLGDDYGKLLGLYTNLVAQVRAANQRNSR